MGTDGRATMLNLTSVLPGVLGIQGAVPLHSPTEDTGQEHLVGSIGASGGTPDEDEAVARAAVLTS